MATIMGMRRRLGTVTLAGCCLVILAGIGWSFFGPDTGVAIGSTAGSTTASIAPQPPAVATGPSGLPIPRFVSLKAEKVNVRRGPSSDHPVAWVFQRKGLPVEIIAEFENWRRVRDSDGEEGWILQSMLAGKRTAVVAPWRGQQLTLLHSAPNKASSVYARLEAGAMGEVSNCTGKWCEITAGGYDGFVEQDMLWGVYPGETVN
jgi:SH3-like domain-containing protein